MTNITLFGGKKFSMPALPEGFQDNLTQTIAGNSAGMPRISIRGSAFRQIIGGKEVHVSEDRNLDVVLINAAPIARTYYGSTYDESVVTPPKCWSSDGISPASDVAKENRQSSKCATCPKNIKGSGQGDTRACRFSQRLAVMLDGEIEERKVYQLQLPATSIFGDASGEKMPLQAYGKFLKANGVSVAAVVTRMKFDVNSSTPKLYFNAVRPLNAAELEAVIEMKDSEDAVRAITMTVSQADGVEPDAPEGSAKNPRAKPAPAVEDDDDTVFEEAPAPKKKAKPAPVVEDDEDEEEEPAPAPKKKAKPAPVVEDDEDEEEPDEPVVVKSKKAAPAPASKNLDDLMDDWDD